MKVKLERTLSIPTEPFCPAKVTVSIEEDIQNESDYKKLSEKLDIIQALEIIRTLDEMKTIADIGYKPYLQALQKHESEFLEILKNGE